jgi:hypothetical protein
MRRQQVEGTCREMTRAAEGFMVDAPDDRRASGTRVRIAADSITKQREAEQIRAVETATQRIVAFCGRFGNCGLGNARRCVHVFPDLGLNMPVHREEFGEIVRQPIQPAKSPQTSLLMSKHGRKCVLSRRSRSPESISGPG